MGHASPFKTYKFQDLFNDIKICFNPINFDPCNRSLKIQESIKTLTPKVGAHLGMWKFIPSHSPTLPRA